MTNADSSQYAKLEAIGFIVFPFVVQFVAILSLNAVQNTWYWIILAPTEETGVIFLSFAFFRAGLHLWRGNPQSTGVHIQIGQPKSNGSWATYYHPIGVIEVHGSGKDEQLHTEYCKTIIGIDHEYMHHVLFRLEGKKACESFDNLAGNLLDHCRWVGINLIWEGRTEGFWNRVDP